MSALPVGPYSLTCRSISSDKVKLLLSEEKIANKAEDWPRKLESFWLSHGVEGILAPKMLNASLSS